jgi:excisionase family DNA binding protein
MEVFMHQNLISIKEMASKLYVPVSWLYSRTRTKEIPHYKIGKYVRFDETEVMEWIRKSQAVEQEA